MFIVAPFLQWNDDGIALAKDVGVPVLLTEYNSASCGGDPSVAPTVRSYFNYHVYEFS